MKKSLIFDADNTLYKTNPKEAYKKQFSFICDSLRLDEKQFEEEWKKIIAGVILSNSLIERSRKYSLMKTINVLLDKASFKENKAENIVDKSIDLFYKELFRGGVVFDKNTASMILSLKKKYDIFIASDEYKEPLEKKLSFVFRDFLKYFDDVVCCEDAGCLKPSKKFYEILIEKYSLNPKECIIIGDSWKRDLEPAKQMQITTILVNEKQEGSPDFWIKEIKQLKEILLNN